ncbi:MAG: hypothetical protein U1E56_08950 [Bauldia sp.]
MFKGLIEEVKGAAGSLAAKYLLRLAVGLFFVAAVGFGAAAATQALAQKVGAISASAIMAGSFAVVGLLALAAIALWEKPAPSSEPAVAEATKQDAAETVQVATDVSLGLVEGLLSTKLGPLAATALARLAMRNLPLVAFLALLAALFYFAPSRGRPAPDSGADGQDVPSADSTELRQAA